MTCRKGPRARLSLKDMRSTVSYQGVPQLSYFLKFADLHYLLWEWSQSSYLLHIYIYNIFFLLEVDVDFESLCCQNLGGLLWFGVQDREALQDSGSKMTHSDCRTNRRRHQNPQTYKLTNLQTYFPWEHMPLMYLPTSLTQSLKTRSELVWKMDG